MTIQDQIEHHRSIRKFKDQPLSPDQLTQLYQAARHTSTSMFLQQFSLIHLTDPQKRAQVRAISGQPYVGAQGELFIFIADLHRNQQIRQQLGHDDGRLHTTDVFLQAVNDTVLAVQNTLTAAEGMGLGGVILGSVNDDPARLVEVLNLPPLTMPILGLQVGVPDQAPQLKPRLPLDQLVFENDYPDDFQVQALKDYDQVGTTYYDLRQANRRLDSFMAQITGPKLNQHPTKRDQIGRVLQQQGLCLDWPCAKAQN